MIVRPVVSIRVSCKGRRMAAEDIDLASEAFYYFGDLVEAPTGSGDLTDRVSQRGQ